MQHQKGGWRVDGDPKVGRSAGKFPLKIKGPVPPTFSSNWEGWNIWSKPPICLVQHLSFRIFLSFLHLSSHKKQGKHTTLFCLHWVRQNCKRFGSFSKRNTSKSTVLLEPNNIHWWSSSCLMRCFEENNMESANCVIRSDPMHGSLWLYT